MGWTNYQKLLAVMMVITGSINSLTTKWADQLHSKGSDGQDRLFDHPFVQAAAMFLGEILCLIIFKMAYYFTKERSGSALTNGNQNFNAFILMPAAIFDLVGTSIMYIGLTLTYVSSFQMFRGSIIIFVVVLSTIFLHRVVMRREWVGISSIIFGLLVVGLTDAIYESPENGKGRNAVLTGNLLIIIAQIVSACQMVYEEKFVAGLNIPPLQAVGWEGVFGFSVLSVLLAIFYWIPAPPHFGNNARGTIEDVVDGLVQIHNNPMLSVAIVGTIVSIAFFNFAGVSVTKEMSATTRMVLDSVRTFVIWMFSLAVKWQIFHWPHLIGFALLILGMSVYHGLIPRCGRNNHLAEDIESVMNTEPDIEPDDAPQEPEIYSTPPQHIVSPQRYDDLTF